MQIDNNDPSKLLTNILVAYNGSKLMQISIGDELLRGGRVLKKLYHRLNFRINAEQAIALNGMKFTEKQDKQVKNKYFVRSESEELFIFSPTSKERALLGKTDNLLDCSQLVDSLTNRVFVMNEQVLIMSQ